MTFPDGSVHSSINGKDIGTQICKQPVGNVATDISDFQKEFQAATAAAERDIERSVPRECTQFWHRQWSDVRTKLSHALFLPDECGRAAPTI